MVDAQLEINKLDKDNATEIEHDGTGDKWSGKVEIKGFKKLTKIDIEKCDITEVIIEDCPLLTEIDLSDNEKIIRLNAEKAEINPSGEGAKNKIETIKISGKSGRGEDFEELNLKNCVKLEKIIINDLKEIKIIKGAKDFDNPLNDINMAGSTGFHLTTTDELERLEAVEKVNDEILGGSGNIPMKTGSDGKPVVDIEKLKGAIAGKASGDSLNSIGEELGLAGNEVKDKDKIIAKIKELKQQVTQAVNNLLSKINDLGLGLSGADITEQKVLNKITELINRPTRDDYNKIKTERDVLKNGTINKVDMDESNKVVFEKLGISFADYEGRVVNVKASEAEKIRNELIEKKFGELSNEKNTAFYLNIGLSILVIGSLAGIIWLLLRENKPKTESEPENEKEPAKIKK